MRKFYWAAYLFCSLYVVQPSPALNYYVNDTNTAGDVWATAVGSDTNTGASASSPALSIQAIIDLYDLEGGDTIYVDTGLYTLTGNTTILASDSGSSTGSFVHITGAGTTNTIIDRSSLGSGAYAIHVDGASFIRFEDIGIINAGQGIRIANAGSVEVLDCEISQCSIGVVLSSGSGHTINSCEIHNNDRQAVLGSSSATANIIDNTIYNNESVATDDRGIDLSFCNNADIENNIIYGNGDAAIRLSSCGTADIDGNTIYGNGSHGIYLLGSSFATVEDNSIRNCHVGLYMSGSPSLVARRNTIHSNTNQGFYAYNGSIEAKQNLIYANGTIGMECENIGSSDIENNTLYRNGTIGLSLWGNYTDTEVRNNILVSHGPGQTCQRVASLSANWFSDYNNFYATGGAFVWDWIGTRYSLGLWQEFTNKDRHSFDVDPLFVDVDGPDNILGGSGGADDDFHLQSVDGSYHGGAFTADGQNSLGLDAGDPDSPVGSEPMENGGRINLGAYGGTDQASKSGNIRRIALVYPNEGGVYFRRIRARWATSGPWTTNDQVRVEYSPDSGTNWFAALNGNPLDAGNSIFGWDMTGISTGANYRLRVIFLGDTNLVDVSDADFEIIDGGPKVVYVNDGSLSGDQWATAVGSFSNSGLTPNDPFESIQAALDRYPELGAGDEIRVDTGNYNFKRTIYFSDDFDGSFGSNFVIKGSSIGTTKFDREDTSYDVVLLDQADYMRIENLELTGGDEGVEIDGDPGNTCQGVEIVGCKIHDNNERGINIDRASGVLISSNQIYNHSGQYGVSLEWSSGNIFYNEVYNNRWGVRVGTGSGSILAKGNVLRNNTDDGLTASVFITADVNEIFSNSGRGINLSAGGAVQRNVIYANGGAGVYIQSFSDSAVNNNLLYDNGSSQDYYNLYCANHTTRGTVENNTMYGGSGLYVHDPFAFTNRNNIIWATGSGRHAVRVDTPPSGSDVFISDYNNYYATGGAYVGHWLGIRSSLDAWQQVVLRDLNSLSIDPRFVGLSTNFHLKSTSASYKGDHFSAPSGGVFTADAELSFCIDAGDPASAFSTESADNGGRANIGAFGNTSDASRSPGSTAILLTEPNGDVQWFGVQSITWLTRGPWGSNDTVRLEYSDNGGSSWNLITNGVNFSDGSYSWDTGGLTPGTNFQVRVYRDGDMGTIDGSDASFEVSASGPRTYYVNDGSLSADIFTTAVGNDSNDGLTAGTPKARVQSVLDTYNVKGDDTIKVDTGNYLLSGTIIITTNDMGSFGSLVVIEGSTNGPGSVLDRQGGGTDVLYLPGTDYVRLENLKVTGGTRGVYVEGSGNDACDGIEIIGCEVYSNSSVGVSVTGHFTNRNDGVEVSSCDIHDNAFGGVVFGHCENILINNNEVYNNGAFNTGLSLGDVAGQVLNNTVYGNGTGLSINNPIGSLTVAGNTIRNNSAIGVYRNNSGSLVEIVGNRIYLNGGRGLDVSGLSDVRRNVIYSNGGAGVYEFRAYGSTIANNLFYDNGATSDFYNIRLSSLVRCTLENNTLYGGSGLYVEYPVFFTNRNNIIWATGSSRQAIRVNTPPSGSDVLVSDYNNLYATDGAVVGYWLGNQAALMDYQFASGGEANSFSEDPLFVDVSGPDVTLGGTNGLDDNFHLKSTIGSHTGDVFSATDTGSFATNDMTSPCIDAGDPSVSIGDELSPNGGRINIGAFGGIEDASLSPEAKSIELVSVTGGEVIRGTRRVTWLTQGPWTIGDTVNLEYSADSGTNWTQILGAETIPFEQGYFDWDTSALTPGSQYRLQITDTGSNTVTFMSGDFQIIGPGAAMFYVNDNSISNDLFTTVIGNDANNGISSSTPKATLKNLLQTYTLVPGDVVKVDTGDYELDATLQLFDSGSVAQSITFLGSTNGPGSVLDRQGGGTDVIYLPGTDYVRLENLKITGGPRGVYVEGGGSDVCEGIEVVGCEVYGNSSVGVSVTGHFTNRNDGVEVSSCDIHDNAFGGVVLGDCENILINNNEVYNNGAFNTGLDLGSMTGQVLNNTVYGNGTGLSINNPIGLVTVSGNTIRNNTYSGVHRNNIGSLVEIVDNRIYLNGGRGLEISGLSDIRRNVIYSNGHAGIYEFRAYGSTIANNLVYDNGAVFDFYNIRLSSLVRCTLENNTLYGGSGLYVEDPVFFTNRNNIIWATGSSRQAMRVNTPPSGLDVLVSDYNNLYATDGAVMGYWNGSTISSITSWVATASIDSNSLSLNPLFVDIDGSDDLLGGFNGNDDDFHLKSKAGSYHSGAWLPDLTNSPSIDAGDLWLIGYTNEPSYNGLRLNQGAYGGTDQASKSDYSGPFYSLNAVAEPAHGGTISIWPPSPASMYPTNREITMAAAANANSFFNQWVGSITTTNNPVLFYVDNHMTVTGVFEVSAGFIMDGAVDFSSYYFSTSSIMLYAAIRSNQLYVATQSPGSFGAGFVDHFILVSDELLPTASAPAPWANPGTIAVAATKPYLAGEADNSYVAWFNTTGPTQAFKSAATSGYMEGTVQLAEFAPTTTVLYVAAGGYITFGGGLITQAPQGNADGNIDPNEFFALPIASLIDSHADGVFDLLDPDRGFVLERVGESGVNFEIVWPVVPGRQYDILYKDLLEDGWSVLPGGPFTAQSGDSTLTVVDTTSSGVPRRYYLIRLNTP